MLKEICSYLLEQGFESQLKDDTIEVTLKIEGYCIVLTLKLPQHFPYEFVKVYLYDSYDFSIPHRYTDKMLCLYDNSEVIPNPEMYLEETVSTIRRAETLIYDSIMGNNKEDVNKECVAIWNAKEKFHVQIIYDDISSSQIISGIELFEDWYIVSDQYKLVQSYIECSYRKKEHEYKKVKAFYCKLGMNKMYTMPKTLGDIMKLIYRDKKNKDLFLSYMRQNHRKAIVVLEFNNGFSNCLVCLKAKQLVTKHRIISSKIYGVLLENRNSVIIRGEVNDLSMQRIFTRGGDGKSTFVNRCIIIGCGSVGSILVKALVESGISKKLSIIDKEYLSYENIGRHLCGSIDAYSLKVEAIRKKIISHYPAVECDAIVSDAYDYLDNQVDLINTNDFLFIVVGNENIEKKTIDMVKNKLIKSKVVIVWIEPYLVAGHAVILQNEVNERTEESLFDDNKKFNVSVLENTSSYLKSEAGCQSAYAPYSGFDVQRFVLSFIDTFKTKFCDNVIEGNYLYTWLGNMKWARQNSIKIKPEWRAKDDGTISLKRID